jgi:hypothetical protein
VLLCLRRRTGLALDYYSAEFQSAALYVFTFKREDGTSHDSFADTVVPLALRP